MVKHSENPYKPGTEEFRKWELNLIQHQQLDTVDRAVAITIADRRLAQLKLEVTPTQRSLALQDLLDSLPKPGEVFTNSQLLIQEVNTIWAEIGLGPEFDFWIWLPQIVTAPPFATKYQLYKCLHNCVGVNLKLTKTLDLRWAIQRPYDINRNPFFALDHGTIYTTFHKHCLIK